MPTKTPPPADQLQLFAEVACRHLWQMVVDEDQPQPRWLDHPAYQSPALERVLDSGVDTQDLTDLIRDIQVQMIVNFAQFLDYPQEDAGDLPAEFELLVGNIEGPNQAVSGIHKALVQADPTSRFGAPRSLLLRRFQALSVAQQSELRKALGQQQFAMAAKLWKQGSESSLAQAMADVHALAQEL